LKLEILCVSRTEITMKEIEKIRNARRISNWVPWLHLAAAAIWFIVLIINVSAGNAGTAATNAACVGIFMVAFHATARRNLDREFAREICRLREELDGKNDASRQAPCTLLQVGSGKA